MARQKDKTAEMELRSLSKIKETLEEYVVSNLMMKIKNGLTKHNY